MLEQTKNERERESDEGKKELRRERRANLLGHVGVGELKGNKSKRQGLNG